ncbi:MAG: S1 family peptidase [Opitutaceae bacterium]
MSIDEREKKQQEEPFSAPTPMVAAETLEEKVQRLKAELKAAEKELAESLGEIVEHASAINTDEQADSLAIPSGSLVVVSGENGSGSGFMATIKDRVFFVTNIHVLGAARGAEFTTVDGVEVRLADVAFLSRGRDIAIVPVEWDGPVLKLSPSLRFDDVKIGEKITVMGNSSGASVATRLKGEIRGIGPEELEVSAKFVPGNSGSPIVHDELGTVIAVASHLKDFSSDSKWTKDSGFDKIRRFGYRLDGEIAWEQVSIDELFNQSEVYQRFEERTIAMWNISYTLTYESKLLTSYKDHESLGHLYRDISSDFNWDRGTASAHNAQMLKRFLNGMMSEVQNDISNTDRAIKLGYYREQFDNIRGYRNTIQKNIDRFTESRL